MAKITICGDSCVVTSCMTLEEIADLEKYRPSALCLYKDNDEGKREMVFRVATGNEGTVGKYGMVFASATRDEQKLATITLAIPNFVENAVDYVADKVGGPLVNLFGIEAQCATAAAEVAQEKAAVRACIQVVG